MEMNVYTLLSCAESVRKNAHAPYSNFHVGAALMGINGKIYTGCNIENATYGATICAERVALGNAIADGCNKFVAIAVVGAHRGAQPDTPCLPCGICRQVLAEFCPSEFPIYLRDGENFVCYTLEQLLPHAFCL